MAPDKTLDNLPPYLRHTAFGLQIRKALHADEEPLPHWVSDSLIYETTFPGALPAATKQELASSSDSNREIDTESMKDDDNADMVPGDTMFAPAEFVGESRSIWLGPGAQRSIRENDSDSTSAHAADESARPARASFGVSPRRASGGLRTGTLSGTLASIATSGLAGRSATYSGRRTSTSSTERHGTSAIRSGSNASSRATMYSSDGGDDSDAAKPEVEVPRKMEALPSQWDFDNYSSQMSNRNGLITIDAPSSELSQVTSRSFTPIPALCGTYYFEVKIEPDSFDRTVIVGVSTDPSKGHDVAPPKQWAYFSDDGSIMGAHGSSRKFAASSAPGDVIGCGVNFRTRTVFYTKNGYYIGQAFKDLPTTGPVFPMLGLHHGTIVSTNFGTSDFRYDITKYITDEKCKILAEIETRTEPPSQDINKLIFRLIGDYFEHAGYKNSAAALQRELDGTSEDLGEDALMEDAGAPDEDAERRQQIRTSMLAGNVEDVYKVLQDGYPEVLTANPYVQFNLQCFEFAQAVVDPTQLDRALMLGRALRTEYSDSMDPAIQKRLNRVLALLAYREPAEMASNILGPQARVDLADRISSAIVASRGLYDSALLPKLIGHTIDALEKLAAVDPTAAHINVVEDML